MGPYNRGGGLRSYFRESILEDLSWRKTLDNIKHLGEERIGKLIIRYSTPAIAGLVVYGLNRIVGNVFIGRFLGVEALAGYSVANSPTMIVLSFVIMMGTGSSALISIRLGQEKRTEATATLGSALTLSAVFTLPLMFLCVFAADPVLRLFGASGESLRYGSTYLRIYAIGIVFQFWNTIFNSAIRAEGLPFKALVTNIISFFAGLALTPFFLFVIPLGIAGVAVALVLSQFLVMLWLGAHFLGRSTAFPLTRSAFRPKAEAVKQMLAIGIAPFSIQFLGACLSLVLNNIVVQWAGDTGLAIMGVVFSLYFLLIMPAQGTSVGIQPIIGYNYGAGKHDRVKRTVDLSLAVLIVVFTAEFFAVFFFRRDLAALFLTGQERILDLCGRALFLAVLAFPVIGIQTIASSYFQSTGKARLAIAVNLFRSLFILIPYFVLPLFWGFDGIFLSFPLADTVTAALCAYLLYRDRIKAVPSVAEI